MALGNPQELPVDPIENERRRRTESTVGRNGWNPRRVMCRRRAAQLPRRRQKLGGIIPGSL